MEKILGSLLSIGLFVSIGTANAQNYANPVDISGTETRSGKIQISGGTIGCVSLKSSQIIIPYLSAHNPPPELKAYGSVHDPRDRVEIENVALRKDRAIITFSTYGRNQNQICANSFINFTVQSVP